MPTRRSSESGQGRGGQEQCGGNGRMGRAFEELHQMHDAIM